MVAARAGSTGFVLNADDPLVADLGRDRELSRRPGVTYFGIEDPSQALPELQHAHDAKHCRRCGAPVRVRARLRRPPRPLLAAPTATPTARSPTSPRPRSSSRDVAARASPSRRPSGERRLHLPLPGLYNVYNALAALAAALRLGVALDETSRASSRMEAVFGRVETIEVDGTPVSILLIKNPAGANEVLRTLQLEAGDDGARLDLWIALNDRIADGRDVSWVWDADFELLAGRVRRVVCAGTRAPEMALRLKYAGVDPAAIEVVHAIERSLDRAIAGADGRLFALPTYTALLELRTLLPSRGLAPGLLAMTEPDSARRGGDLARRRVRRLRRRPRAVVRARRRGGRARCSTSAAGTGRVALHLAARGPSRSRRVDRDDDLLAALRRARRRRGLRGRDGGRRRARLRPRRAASR